MCMKPLIYKDKTTAHIGPFILPRVLRLSPILRKTCPDSRVEASGLVNL